MEKQQIFSFFCSFFQQKNLKQNDKHFASDECNESWHYFVQHVLRWNNIFCYSYTKRFQEYGEKSKQLGAKFLCVNIVKFYMIFEMNCLFLLLKANHFEAKLGSAPDVCESTVCS